ncbi:Os12g0220800, partial [Oryza sativa Japonica Group]
IVGGDGLDARRRRRTWPRLLSRVPAASSAWRRLVGAWREDGRGRGFVAATVVVAALPSSPAPASLSPFSLCPAFVLGMDAHL